MSGVRGMSRNQPPSFNLSTSPAYQNIQHHITSLFMPDLYQPPPADGPDPTEQLLGVKPPHGGQRKAVGRLI
jgi:hypothetical protein